MTAHPWARSTLSSQGLNCTALQSRGLAHWCENGECVARSCPPWYIHRRRSPIAANPRNKMITDSISNIAVERYIVSHNLVLLSQIKSRLWLTRMPRQLYVDENTSGFVVFRAWKQTKKEHQVALGACWHWSTGTTPTIYSAFDIRVQCSILSRSGHREDKGR